MNYLLLRSGGWGWCGEMQIKANLSQSLVEVEAELGNKNVKIYVWIPMREGGKDRELGIGYFKSFCFQNILLYCYGYFCVCNDKIGIFRGNTH